MSCNYSAALDLSGREAGFALLNGAKIVLSEILPMYGRDSAQLAKWVESKLKTVGAPFDSIVKWSVGSGPGSFTGMRLAAALISGLTFDKPGVLTRCVPTAVALAANCSAPQEGERIGALFDGRNRELIFFEMQIRAGEAVPTGEEQVLNSEQATKFFTAYTVERLIGFESEFPALEKLLDPAVAAKIERFTSIKPEALALSRYKPFDNNLSDLVYIRPAVFASQGSL
ncbi:MAG: tRNA (adenosine(37)-N6)-threonylcarbamoyltransferase complex dimerization subunit type 1 TsaB [Victivallales bacterium]|jgi:tRNA threonylcarbamoyl adenosine modification protein YeaZ|nr:tRNA (adenosine(37)-N6)-threonylcarbamoyltransferase complex dimerization subunit type 1 TsaB [Victivallales bacterium]